MISETHRNEEAPSDILQWWVGINYRKATTHLVICSLVDIRFTIFVELYYNICSHTLYTDLQNILEFCSVDTYHTLIVAIKNSHELTLKSKVYITYTIYIHKSYVVSNGIMGYLADLLFVFIPKNKLKKRKSLNGDLALLGSRIIN